MVTRRDPLQTLEATIQITHLLLHDCVAGGLESSRLDTVAAVLRSPRLVPEALPRQAE